MAQNRFQSDQTKHDASLAEIAPSAETPLDTILTNINAKLVDPLSLSVTGSSLVLTVGHAIITSGPDGKKRGIAQLKNIYMGDVYGSIDFADGTTVTQDMQATTLPTFTGNGNKYIRAGVELRSDKKLYIVWGTMGNDTDPATAGAPAFSKSTDQVGEILLRINSGGTAFSNPAMSAVTQFGAGGSGGGSGSGVGGINYVDNTDGEIDASKWTAYVNTVPGALPTSSFGTLGAGWTLTVTATTPLRGVKAFLITKDSGTNHQGYGVYADLLAFDFRDTPDLINVSFDYETSGYQSGQMAVYLWDITNDTRIDPVGRNSLPHGKGTATYQFYTVGTSSSYRLMFHNTVTSTAAWTVEFDNVIVGPEATRESIKQCFYNNSHGFAVGDVIYQVGSSFGKASAADIAQSKNLALVVSVPDSNTFVALFRGWARLPSGKTTGQWYLSETAGATVSTDNQKYSVPVYFVSSNNECYFNPGEPKRVTEEGDVSFRPYRVASSTAYLSGGAIKLSNGEILVSGSGTTEATVKVPISIDLGTVSGDALVNDTTYWLYIDRENLPAATTLSDSGRKVINVSQASNFKRFTAAPDAINPLRYVEVGYFRYATAAWSTTAFGWAPSRTHDQLSDYFSTPEVYKNVAINTNTVTDLTHNLSGAPQIIQIYFYDNSASERQPLDASSYIRKVSATTITIDSNGFTFDSGDYLEVEATYLPVTGSQVATMSSQFESAWFTDTATTTLAHNRTDMNDIKGIIVQEWDTTTGRRRTIPTDALVTEWDDTNLYLNWAGLSPSATLKYRITTGGNALPQAVPYTFGGFTKYVGMGMGSYATLAAALAAAAAGDAILVGRSETITSTVTVSLSDIKIEFMPGTKLTASGTPTNGLVISGSRNRVINPWVDSGVALTTAIQLSGDDNFVEGAKVTNSAGTITNAYEFTSTAERNWLNGTFKATGTITNGVIDAVPANSNDYSVRG